MLRIDFISDINCPWCALGLAALDAAQEYSAPKQLELKRALMEAYQGSGRDISQTEVLLEVIMQVGLDKIRAEKILSSDEFAQAVRTTQQEWINAGISAVPSLVINRQHLLQGAQTPETYAQALRDIAQQTPN